MTYTPTPLAKLLADVIGYSLMLGGLCFMGAGVWACFDSQRVHESAWKGGKLDKWDWVAMVLFPPAMLLLTVLELFGLKLFRG